jgi:hypothetical protein
MARFPQEPAMAERDPSPWPNFWPPDEPPGDDFQPTYVPDVQSLWASEKARALLVVLTRRFGPDFAREVHNEMFARAVGYEGGCADDNRDGETLVGLLNAPLWDRLFETPEPETGK